MTKLSIIIVNWNTKMLLSQCLKSIIQKSKIPLRPRSEVSKNQNFEVIVVDNGSSDGSAEMVEEEIRGTRGERRIRIIKNKENLGYAKGNNIGIREAKGEYILLLNSDVIVQENAIEKLVDSLNKSSSEVAAVSPLVLNSDGTIQKDPCYLKFPSPVQVLFYYNSFLKKIALNYFPKLLFSVTDFSKPSLIDQLPGAAIMVRKKVLDKIGVFDENFRIYFEDTDLCFRMKKAGYKLLLVPEGKIIHLGRQSIKPLIDSEGIMKFYLLNFESLFRFCKKHYSFVKYHIIKIIILKQILITLKFDLFKNLMVFK